MENSTFGNVLIGVRKQRGLTQGEVAEKCNVTIRTIQRIESGHVQPRSSTIKIISEKLEFDYFNSSNTGYDEVNTSRPLEMKAYDLISRVKDLFNLKTYTMKKISILTLTALLITIGLNAINPDKESIKNNNSIVTIYNKDQTLNFIEVRFSNNLTLDSLITIKSNLEGFGIKINYKTIGFDKNNYLQELECEAFTELGSGSFHSTFMDSSMSGFYCNYAKNAESSFCIGEGCLYRKKK